MSRVAKLILPLIVVIVICIVQLNEAAADGASVPASFQKYWAKQYSALKWKQYEVFLQDATWPQLAGYSAVYSTKAKFLTDTTTYWSQNRWKNPKIYRDKDALGSLGEVNVVRVEFEEEDLMFEYLDRGGVYKLVAIYTNLAGGD